MTEQIDLLTYVTTFPNLPEPQVLRSNLVKWLYANFSPDRKVILIQGPDGMGKTTLLAQFVKTYAERCFHFFIRRDQWASNPRYFLRELCAQMQKLLYGEEDDLDAMNYYELKELFSKIYRKIGSKARSGGRPFFFVVDGLEWIPDSLGQESILDLLPHDPPEGIYALFSSTKGQELPFVYDSYNLMPFSKSETEDYLSRTDLDLDDAVIQRIYNVSDGMPGYLHQICREIKSGRDVLDIVDNLPPGFQDLLLREWRRMASNDDSYLNVLAMLAHSEIPLSLQVISEITAMDIYDLERYIKTVPFLDYSNSEGRSVRFVTDAHRNFTAKQLVTKKSQVELALIEYYKKNPYRYESLEQLPRLLRQARNYEVLKGLITVDYLKRAFQETRDVYLLQNGVRILADYAYEQAEWETLAKCSLLSSVLRTLSLTSVAESQIEALLALGHYEESLSLAYSSLIAEDKLQLIARICEYMQLEGLPIPSELVIDLRNMVHKTEFGADLRERAIEIAASLFYIDAKLASEFVQKITSTDPEAPSIEMIFTLLAFKLENRKGALESVTAQILNPSLRSLVFSHSSVVENLEAEEVLLRMREIEKISDKLFLLLSWCNSNRDNMSSLTVIRTALDLMTESTSSVSMRHLRQFAEPLLACDISDANSIISHFDLLKDTAIKNPIEEWVRLELRLASVEAKISIPKAQSRVQRVLDDLKLVKELDARCSGLVRVLLDLPKIDPSNISLLEDIESDMFDVYRSLLDGSGDHFAVTHRLISALMNYKPELAIRFTDYLNTLDRRDKTYHRILLVYIDRDRESIDFQLVKTLLTRIQDEHTRNQAFVDLLGALSERDLVKSMSHIHDLVADVEEIANVGARCTAYAYIVKMAISMDEEKTQCFFDRLVDSWEIIDQHWRKVQIGFDLTAILGKDAPDFAEKLYDTVVKVQEKAPLARSDFVHLYSGILQLAIRTFPDLLKTGDYASRLHSLVQSIRSISSFSLQCFLLADIALRLYLWGKQNEFDSIIRDHILTTLDCCESSQIRALTIVAIAPCLYQYDRDLLKQEVSQLSIFHAEQALSRTINYLICKTALTDPIHISSLNAYIEYKDALQICELLSQMSTDIRIYSVLRLFVDLLVKNSITFARRASVRWTESQAFTIAEKLKTIVENKLPDSRNIQHNGYRIAAYAVIASLRDAATRRASKQWEELAPSWSQIVDDVRLIPNTADKLLVMVWVGARVYSTNSQLGKQLLENARDKIPDIPNLIDRSRIYREVAEAWHDIADEASAKFFLEEAMNTLQGWMWDETRDELTGQILELAHTIDPEFAAKLTAEVDNPIVETGLEHDIKTRDLHAQPEKLPEKSDNDLSYQYLMGATSRRLLGSLCSGKALVQRSETILKWTHRIINSPFQYNYDVIAWAIQNEIDRNKSKNISRLKEVYDSLLEMLQLTLNVSRALMGVDRERFGAEMRPSVSQGTIELLPAGMPDLAFDKLNLWLLETAMDETITNVRIYDPYFTPDYLFLLKSINLNARVDILTSWHAQKRPPGDSEIEDLYRDAWRNISDQVPPETHIHLIGTATGKTPMHNRYIVANNKGIQIGTSISGLGNKDSDIHNLTEDETASIENQFITPLLLGIQRQHGGEKLLYYSFLLKYYR